MGYAVTEFFIWCVSHAVGLMQITSFYLVSIVEDRHSCVVTSCCSFIKFIINLNKINLFYTLVVFSVLQPFAYLFLKTGETPASTRKILVSGLSEKKVTQRLRIERFLETLIIIFCVIIWIAEIVPFSISVA